jgi:glycosyltransferase involved in cell wall biosynthesis
MRSIVVDFTPLKAGGGCQLGLNFFSEVRTRDIARRMIFLIPDVGPLATLQQENPDLTMVQVKSSSMVARYTFEKLELPRIYRDSNVTHVLTLVGSGLPHPRHIKSVVGVDYPIICYDDSPYWGYLPLRRKVFQRVKNTLRKQRINRADVLLVETNVMRDRLKKVLRFPGQYVVQPPYPSHTLQASQHTHNRQNNILLLSSCVPHKNLWELPAIAVWLQREGIRCNFILTVTSEEFAAANRGRWDLSKLDVYFTFVGKVHPTALNALYEKADFLMLISDLESYSSNYLEAWKAGIPLISSDREFAREICRDSAFYLEPHDPKSAATVIAGALTADASEYQRRVQAGKEYLKSIPTPQQSVDTIVTLLQ